MGDFIVIDATHTHPDPKTGLVGRLVLAVRYGPNEAEISMPLETPATFDTLEGMDLHSRALELAEAMLRILREQPRILRRRSRPT
jgi:hypothetical protein